jgi:hypothetical protein
MSRFRAQDRTTDKFSIRRLDNLNAEDVELHSGKPCRPAPLPFWVSKVTNSCG